MPITDAYGQGFTSLDYGDAPDLKVMGEGLLKVVRQTVMPFASATARSAAIAAPLAGMTTWLSDVGRLEVYNGSAWTPPAPAVTTTTSGATAGSGFSVTSFSGRRTSSGVTMLNLTVTRTGTTIPADAAGNIADTSVATFPAGWRPPEQLLSLIDDGFGAGSVVIDTAGLVTLRTWSGGGAIVAGRNLRVTALYI